MNNGRYLRAPIAVAHKGAVEPNFIAPYLSSPCRSALPTLTERPSCRPLFLRLNTKRNNSCASGFLTRILAESSGRNRPRVGQRFFVHSRDVRTCYVRLQLLKLDQHATQSSRQYVHQDDRHQHDDGDISDILPIGTCLHRAQKLKADAAGSHCADDHCTARI